MGTAVLADCLACGEGVVLSSGTIRACASPSGRIFSDTALHARPDTTQSVHRDEPVASAYLPAAHTRQSPITVAPDVPRYVPTPHGEHVMVEVWVDAL